MEQIPERNLLSAQLLSAQLLPRFPGDVMLSCCMNSILEYTFKDIYHHLHAVISYEPSFDPLSSLDPRIDLTRPYYYQGQWFHLDESIIKHVFRVHGTFHFHHKSFDDFLRDSTRSGAFCVKIPAYYSKYFDHLIRIHHHYASSYAIDGSSTYFLGCICP